MIQTRCAPSLPPPDALAESSEREKEKGGWRGMGVPRPPGHTVTFPAGVYDQKEAGLRVPGGHSLLSISSLLPSSL